MSRPNVNECEYCGGDHMLRDCDDPQREGSLAPAACSAFERGLADGRRDSGKRYNAGMDNGYISREDRAAYHDGYEKGWDEK